jgi:type II secretory pathway pseudopilin PulG
LLVVITVIAILAAMLLPVLARAKERGKRVQCVNNQKQLATTWFMYIADNNDRLPSNGQNNPPRLDPTMWVQGAFVNPGANQSDQYIIDPRYAQFATYIKTSKIYVCPTDRPMVQVQGVGPWYAKVRSYSMNAYMGWVGEWDVRLTPVDARGKPTYQVITKHGQLLGRMPTGAFLFLDVSADSICWPYFGMRMDSDSFFNFPGSTHNFGAEVSFSDGHVEHHRWTDKRTIIAYSTFYHRHDDPSPGNPDLAWLRARTTAPR